jgi:hypothetical protein
MSSQETIAEAVQIEVEQPDPLLLISASAYQESEIRV